MTHHFNPKKPKKKKKKVEKISQKLRLSCVVVFCILWCWGLKCKKKSDN